MAPCIGVVTMHTKEEDKLTNKGGLKKYCKGLIIAIMLCGLYTVTLAANPNVIKVGLESVYKNTSSVKLSSSSNLSVGYFDEWGFEAAGQLDASTINISKATGTYYTFGNVYSSLDEAKQAAVAQGNNAVPAYLQRGIYGVYTKDNTSGLEEAIGNSSRIEVYDANNTLIFVSEQTDQPLVFRGYDHNIGLALTKVGNTKQYRGAIGIAVGQTGITPYNVVDLEEYLYGVVPGEMPASWPEEALKVQAVAARSIATYQYNRYLSSGYNVVDTTSTQVYGGYTIETQATNKAVDATRGEVIKYNGKVAEALYFSTSGGMTEDAKYVWGTEIPYLRSVVDSYETEPAQAAWTRTITLSEIDACLAKLGANIGKAQGVQIASRTASGRVLEMTILGTNGSYTVKNEAVRTFFNGTTGGSLKSRLFSFKGAIHTPGSTLGNITVAVMSADHLEQKEVNNLVVMSAQDMGIISEAVVVQSATTKEALTGNTTSGNIGSNTEVETVWSDFTVYGEGFGHGVGMSQSGAKGMAKAGYSYDEILKYYYTGVTVQQ